MEGNRDEAERCIQIAAQALRESKMEKAEKFLNKAEKLYPSQKAKGNFVIPYTCYSDHFASKSKSIHRYCYKYFRSVRKSAINS